MENRYGVGSAGAHQGDAANLAFVSWSENHNELFHRVAVSSTARPHEFHDAGESGLTGCVWDLAGIGYERQAWIDSVLDPSGPGSVEAYLDARMIRGHV